MTLFDRPVGPETYAMIRYGYGWPARGAPVTAQGMLGRLLAPDTAQARFPKVPFAEAVTLGRDYISASREMKRGVEGADRRRKLAWRAIRHAQLRGLAADLARMAETDDPLRERLVQFWNNHFATRTTGRAARATGPAYADDAIRPHLTGSFADLLKSAVTHPVMLAFLDQPSSVGPNSPYGQRRGRGLNENLAREVIELHTLGVGAGYSQADVRQFAELLTGLTFNLRRDAEGVFDPRRAEPGAETVLGTSYGGDGTASQADIHAALDDLAAHPATAAHLSRKLVAHFTADTPDPALVAAVEAAWRDTGGDLLAVYTALLTHPAAWDGFGAKVKQPLEFMGSALRALEVRGETLQEMKPGLVLRAFLRPLADMGQAYHGPPGPDGVPDEAAAWVQPFGLAQRITWAAAAVDRAATKGLDPVAFARAALGDAASERLLWAAARAETRDQGLALVLASAEFNRR
ncbi:DUF1800 domain-containing protein [Psychromarinibacter sp. C21-152]|uniref:DUF1800 domain-containing protein n=1 Tax=Psychromarinibacter sediminicola TaxID=3033385 RepID=A0AAE3NNN6_9RHOB|nr:DUF1800 domain-containing protein [Psychromarinibacter sediminicola]MDF0599172.1 DUF1800 domain-containing protein [Psychromarinibacter sediminicola]